MVSAKILFGGVIGFKASEMVESYIQKNCPDAEFAFFGEMPLPEGQFIRQAQDATVILSQYQPMTEKIYQSLPQLKAVCSIGIGYNMAHVEIASRHHVMVTNVPDYCIDEVACHTVGLILAMQRKLYQLVPLVKEGYWGYDALKPLTRFRGCTVGLFGFGHIARDVAAKLAGFGVRIIATDPYVDKAVADSLAVELVDFDTLVRHSDYLSLHAPLLPSTEGLFNCETLNKMKPSAYLINTARGALIDTDALYEALTCGWIAGAALDALTHEPPQPIEKKLLALPNVWVTGHTAFYSEEAFEDVFRQAADEACRIVRGEVPLHCVNWPALKIDPASR